MVDAFLTIGGFVLIFIFICVAGFSMDYAERRLEKSGLKKYDGTLLRNRMKFNWRFSWVLTASLILSTWHGTLADILTWVCALASTTIMYLWSVHYFNKNIRDGTMYYPANLYQTRLRRAIPFAIILMVVFLWPGPDILNHPVMVGALLGWPLSAPFIWMYVRKLERDLGGDIRESSQEEDSGGAQPG